MKITEELWNEYSYNTERVKGEDFDFNCDGYFFEVMRKITKKEILKTGVAMKSTTPEGYRKQTELLLSNDFLNKYNLTPAFNYIVSNTCIFGTYNLSGFGNYKHSFLNENTINIDKLPLLLLGDDLIISLFIRSDYSNIDLLDEQQFTTIYVNNIYYTSDKSEMVINILKSLYEINKYLPNIPEEKNGKIRVGFTYRSQEGTINVTYKFVKINNIQLEQFNDSLPHEKIIKILHTDEAGLILLHGEPGCGKSSYIKYLIKECRDLSFIILSQDLLQNMESFREFLLRQKENTVIVIEDCENLVKSRERSGSSLVISDFLNITDGIYGDLFRLKFILTFNTDIQTIDQALLRKGRLKCKYRFNKLKGDRLKKITEKLGIKLQNEQLEEGLSLADLFHYNEDNGGKQKDISKIGFNTKK